MWLLFIKHLQFFCLLLLATQNMFHDYEISFYVVFLIQTSFLKKLIVFVSECQSKGAVGN